MKLLDLLPEHIRRECELGNPEACTENRPPAVRAATPQPKRCSTATGCEASSARPTAKPPKNMGQRLTTHALCAGTKPRNPKESGYSRLPRWSAKRISGRPCSTDRDRRSRSLQYLQGTNGMERIGSGFIAALAALMFAMFDLTASVLVLLGFLIFRWAVIAVPILGTVGLLRPASAGIRRLGNAVVAAIFNIAIFGTGAAIYLFAVDLIMNTASLARLAAGGPGLALWCGRVAAASPVSPDHPARRQGRRCHDRLRRARGIAASSAICGKQPSSTSPRVATPDPMIGKGGHVVFAEQRNLRPEARLEDPAHAAASRNQTTVTTANDGSRPALPARPDGKETVREATPVAESTNAGRPTPSRTRRNAEWTEPDVAERPASYAIYRPETGSTTQEPATPRVRSEAR